METGNKQAAGLNLMIAVIVNNIVVTRGLPKEVRKYLKGPWNGYPWYRMIVPGLRAYNLVPKLIKKFARIIPGRFTDEEQYVPQTHDIIGGNAGLKNEPEPLPLILTAKL